MKWKEISVLTEGICIEAIAGIFHRLGSGGVVIEDPQAARKYENQEEWNPKLVSPDFLAHEFVLIKAYFMEEREVVEELQSCLEAVKENFNVECQVFIDEVRDEDWESSWKKYYHRFKIGERLVIKPSWEDYQPQSGEVVINIDPGMAFGTGIHASTRFCMKFIDQYVKGGEKIIDAGCGSGILSIAAAQLGAVQVLAMDVEELSVKIARENVELNGLSDIITVKLGDIVEEIQAFETDMVVANITAEVVSCLIPEAAKALASGGYLFGSGIVDSRWPGVEKQLKAHGFVIEQVLQDVDWIGVAARKE
ncbi:MAG: 50S ribosomal protein L11 methyltransferase [Syntrophomonas sp.]|uniref:50S ribosomal protein L11 methyltransferase n=1 Tax=Syntrophomonas sp. TaxID=2053627 RepID=UPI0026073EC6|nr:50S ribosomal protein L11 methyltransferase [Syntrophomonas sp.]MDD2510496.1 50S ribosomal protein L11 methyltransferase [Syntrophomonas sp.]MDD3879000.1 50S ribosomal protein L11 methyltransferase [Syntrophomonas sp.]MDD4625945.1 50S ribosomal protein L11 methyltransferase [Syntrophomonas sp.]